MHKYILSFLFVCLSMNSCSKYCLDIFISYLKKMTLGMYLRYHLLNCIEKICDFPFKVYILVHKIEKRYKLLPLFLHCCARNCTRNRNEKMEFNAKTCILIYFHCIVWGTLENSVNVCLTKVNISYCEYLGACFVAMKEKS